RECRIPRDRLTRARSATLDHPWRGKRADRPDRSLWPLFRPAFLPDRRTDFQIANNHPETPESIAGQTATTYSSPYSMPCRGQSVSRDTTENVLWTLCFLDSIPHPISG